MPSAEELAWLIPVLPLFGAVLTGLGLISFNRTINRLRKPVALLLISCVGAAAALSYSILFNQLNGAPPVEHLFVWASAGNFVLPMGYVVDPLGAVMLALVTTIALLVLVYSHGYMAHDKGYVRFFTYLALFSSSMLGLIISPNLLEIYVFWELVGMCSYLLVGFWYDRDGAAHAAQKAFVVNRVGDFGLLLGILGLFWATGSFDFQGIADGLQNGLTAGTVAPWAALLLCLLVFMGPMAKSAQFPLHVWLPDAMEGPTPVSALIHAATMVAAGVFMLCRIFFLLSPDALSIIAWIGGATALMAAVIALQQDDIKRILAYSTLSQLGYMVMAVGLHAPGAAMFHLTTHAFFKAMLFLGAGSVIHALHHEQNIWKMGGLREKMPATYRTFLIGTLALCGVPPLSGFFSKDGILAAAADSHHGNPVLFGIGILAAVLTTLYMGRLVLVAFHGAHRSEQASHAKESPSVMTVPLWILLVPTLGAGFFPVEHMINQTLGLHHAGGHAAAPLAMAFSVLALMIGGSVAWSHYAGAGTDPLTQRFSGLSTLLRNRLWMDEIFSGMIAITHEAVSKLAGWVDQKILRGAIMGLFQHGVDILGRGLRLVQSGSLQTYAFLFVVGVALVIYIVLGGTH